jgi:hypothetical protein
MSFCYQRKYCMIWWYENQNDTIHHIKETLSTQYCLLHLFAEVINMVVCTRLTNICLDYHHDYQDPILHSQEQTWISNPKLYDKGGSKCNSRFCNVRLLITVDLAHVTSSYWAIFTQETYSDYINALYLKLSNRIHVLPCWSHVWLTDLILWWKSPKRWLCTRLQKKRQNNKLMGLQS